MNPLSISTARLDRLRAICLAFPLAVEVQAWGDPTWRINQRIFAMQKGNYPGGRPSVWLKVGPGRQRLLVAENPELIFVPPYVGSKGWVGVYLDLKQAPWPLLRELIDESYQLLAPAKAGGRVAASSRRVKAPDTSTAKAKPKPRRRSTATRK